MNGVMASLCLGASANFSREAESLVALGLLGKAEFYLSLCYEKVALLFSNDLLGHSWGPTSLWESNCPQVREASYDALAVLFGQLPALQQLSGPEAFGTGYASTFGLLALS